MTMQIFLLDNYDSFTFNLAHALEKIEGVDVTVKRNDEVQVEELMQYDKIVLSPGPGLPEEAGLLIEVIRHYIGKKPILGVCLGHQSIAEVCGATLVNLPKVFHGVASTINIIQEDILFKDLPSSIAVGRYHSWVIDNQNIPSALSILATDEHGSIMAFRHHLHDICGVQFHPESVLTPLGEKILSNWVKG
mgnify:CR=1 FL=1